MDPDFLSVVYFLGLTVVGVVGLVLRLMAPVLVARARLDGVALGPASQARPGWVHLEGVLRPSDQGELRTAAGRPAHWMRLRHEKLVRGQWICDRQTHDARRFALDDGSGRPVVVEVKDALVLPPSARAVITPIAGDRRTVEHWIEPADRALVVGVAREAARPASAYRSATPLFVVGERGALLCAAPREELARRLPPVPRKLQIIACVFGLVGAAGGIGRLVVKPDVEGIVSTVVPPVVLTLLLLFIGRKVGPIAP